jgi:hypothetical protein
MHTNALKLHKIYCRMEGKNKLAKFIYFNNVWCMGKNQKLMFF